MKYRKYLKDLTFYKYIKKVLLETSFIYLDHLFSSDIFTKCKI